MNIFSFSGRLNRAKYFWYSVLLWVIFVVLILISSLLISKYVSSGLGIVLSIIFYVLLVILEASLVVKRFHDLDRPGTHFWLLLIPIYNIYLSLVLLFQKGTAGENKYGPDPLA